MPRSRARWSGALVLVLVAAGCGQNGGAGAGQASCKPGLPSSDACSTNAPSYATDIAPLVEKRCLNCHFTGNPNSSVVLETQTQLSGQRQLVETQIYRCMMPPVDEGGTALSDPERTALLQWLVCGAPNN